MDREEIDNKKIKSEIPRVFDRMNNKKQQYNTKKSEYDKADLLMRQIKDLFSSDWSGLA